jgi:broad specificity phosphatase PhoE
VTSLKDYIARQGPIRRQVREDAGDVQFTRSLAFDAASVALPAGISLDDGAARMNAFWRALVEFQHRDVLVVALCVGEER